MSIRRAVLFLPNGKGTGILFAQWKTKAALTPIQATAILTDGGLSTNYFRTTWSNAFPSREPLPERIANKDGTGTDQFWQVFT